MIVLPWFNEHMNATVTTNRNTYVLDIDPYTDDVTLSYGGSVNYYTSATEARNDMMEFIESDVRDTMAVAPWVEV